MNFSKYGEEEKDRQIKRKLHNSKDGGKEKKTYKGKNKKKPRKPVLNSTITASFHQSAYQI